MKTSPLLVVPMLGASLVAQSPLPMVPLPIRGMLPAFQAGIVFDNDMSLIVRKRAGLPAGLDTFAGTGGSGVPEFTVAAISARLQAQAGGLPITLQLDAMSTGNDLLPIVYSSGEFRISVGNAEGWATLYIARTLPPGPGYADVGADVVGYYFENPAFPQQLRQGIYHELVRSDYSTITVPAPASANIAAIDFAMGLLESNRGQRDRGIIETVDKLYFSLTAANAASPNLKQAFVNPPKLDGATIFVAEFDLTGGVTNVSVHATGADLLLPAGVDIDALGMFEVVTPAIVPTGMTGMGLAAHSFCYVISAEDGQMPDELMVVATPYDPQSSAWPSGQLLRLPLRAANGEILVGDGGALPGRVKGVCSQDPDSAGGCMSFGVPTPDNLPVAPRMGLSLTARDLNPGPWLTTDNFKVTGVLSGWGNSPGAAQVIVAVEHPPGTYTFTLLPNRAGNQDTYTFELSLNHPWMTGGLNEYTLLVATLPLPVTPTSPIDISISSKFLRRDPP